MVPKAFLLFDSNMPGMENCNGWCASNTERLCICRFLHSVEIEWCNTAYFSGVDDIDIVLYFFNIIFSKIGELLIKSELDKKPICIILTHDEDFIKHAESTWSKKKQKFNPHLTIVFEKDSNLVKIYFCSFFIDIKVAVISTKKYGASREKDRRNVIDRVNDILSKDEV